MKLQKDHPFYKQIIAIQSYLSFVLVLLASFLVIRFYEWFVIANVYDFPKGSWVSNLYGLGYDIVTGLKMASILGLPYFLIYAISSKIARWFFMCMSSLLIMAQLLLIQYFCQAQVLLGADLFAYSGSELAHIVGVSGGVGYGLILTMVCMLGMQLYAQQTFTIHEYPNLALKVFFAVLFVFLFFVSLPVPNGSKYTSEFKAYVAANKWSYFLNSTLVYLENNTEEAVMDETNETGGQNVQDKEQQSQPLFTYISNDYPFLHKETTPDHLGMFFTKNVKPPNLVFIIVESLGRAYSGKNASLGSYTPFLDSLAEKSLYWENILSSSGRTFEVLPSVLASLPYAEHGFTELGSNMPAHQSLPKILKNNGYQVSFFYGGDADFDNMKPFLEKQNIDLIVDLSNFGSGYQKLPDVNGFTWGYTDCDLFKKVLSESKNNRQKPRLDVILTVSTHDPFQIPNQAHYDDIFSEVLKKQLLSPEKKEFNKGYAKKFASVLYADDALKYFIEAYKKSDPSFANTIFIITGDHRMPEIPIGTQLDRFHVPLLIYSPLLSETKTFASVSSHLDITPSLLAFLKQNAHLKVPATTAWLGQGLDTCVSFRNIHSYPMMRNKSELIDFISGTSFLSGNSVYTITNKMDLEPLNDEKVLHHMKTALNQFKVKNTYTCKNNKIIPDSLNK